MEALGRLTAGIAHDYNNHLTVISANVEMAAHRFDAPQERLLRHTDAALQGVQRAAALTAWLLSLSRQTTPEAEAVEVNRLVRGLDDLLRRMLGGRVALEVVTSAEPWLVWADMNRMENALLSLLVNVRDTMPHGSRLTVTVSNARLGQAVEPASRHCLPGDYVEITMDDTSRGGEGWRADPDMNGGDLSMARAFAQDNGGMLQGRDLVGRGLGLRLLLPRCVFPRPANCGFRLVRKRPRILVVEDDDRVRTTCVEILRDLDYEVLEAPNAMEGFRLIADCAGIDLLFTDLGLPGGANGRALADAARDADPATQVLFTTGYGHADLPDWAKGALLHKPFSPAKLKAKVGDRLPV